MLKRLHRPALAIALLAGVGSPASTQSVPVPPRSVEVRIYLRHECPVARRTLPDVARLIGSPVVRGMRFSLVFSEPDFSLAAARAFLRDYQIRLTPSLDPDASRARRDGVVAVPTAVVWSGGRVVYRGRINDRYAALGTPRSRPKVHDLQNALEDLRAGRAVRVSSTPVVGCAL